MKRFTLLLLICCLGALLLPAQTLTLPQVSQKSVLTQTIGLTDVTITYHRPQVKEREVWGKMVPVYESSQLKAGENPWRAGANENTVISFSHPVQIEGKVLPAGSYGLHVIPTENAWTVAFSTNTTSWGSYFYKKEEDALRVSVQPVAAPHHELLTFDLINQSRDATTIVLNWEKKQLPIQMTVNTHDIVLANFGNELRSLPGFSWQGWNTAAQYCLNNDVQLEKGIAWADQSIRRGANFTNLSTKASLLHKNGKAEEGEAIMQKAMKVATNPELNLYGYSLVGQGRMDEAIKVFEMNAERHPNDPNVFDSLGEAYANRGKKGDKKLAIKHLEKSLSMDPPDNVRANSVRVLQELGVAKYMAEEEESSSGK
jgi:hypothetical protein